jgi:anti-sigma regulatory factor (Ser/Thr protein kinase)
VLVGLTDDQQARAGTKEEPPPAVAGLTLAAVPSAVRCARVFVRACLRQWGLESMAEDSELVINRELVTNAVQATGITETEPRWSQLDGLAVIHVRLVLSDRSLVIAVWDKNPGPPVPAEPGTDSENGRGLAIVAALSQRWDYMAAQGGKCVWAELAIPSGALTPSGLPRRILGPVIVPVAGAPVGLDVLRRVLQALRDL